MSVPELSIIIVNWNGENLLPDCLGSIAEHPPTSAYEVIVVDNASTDQSIAWLESDDRRRLIPDERFRLIKNSENAGFGKANNQAMRRSNSEYIFLLNSDARVDADTFRVMQDTIESEIDAGLVGPILLNHDGTFQASVYVNPPNPLHLLIEGFRIYKLMPKKLRGSILLGPHWDHNSRRICKFVSGAALLFRREVFKKTGGFDEDFFMYGEDLVFCDAITKMGKQIIFEPKARVFHVGGNSSFRKWSQLEKIQYQTAQNFRALKKISSPFQFVLIWLATVSSNCFELVFRFIRNKPIRDVVAVLKGCWEAATFGRSVMGKR